MTVSPQSRRPSPVSSREVRALLRRADKLFAEGAKLQAIAKQALVQHFRQELADHPTADDISRRRVIAREAKKEKTRTTEKK
jgi:hypothetical protein